MALCIDNVHKETHEGFIDEAIMVTITLAEYRALVQENEFLKCENTRLMNELNKGA